jgi:hypothetical protein
VTQLITAPSMLTLLCRPLSSEQAAAQSAWRLARRQWVAQLCTLLAPLQDPVASFRAYVAHVAGTSAASAAAAAAADPASPQHATGKADTAGGVPKSVGDGLVAAAAQDARSAALKLLQVISPAQAGLLKLLQAAVPDCWRRAMTIQLCVWLQVSVLLHYLANKGGAAGWHLTSQQVSALEHELQPQVRA